MDIKDILQIRLTDLYGIDIQIGPLFWLVLFLTLFIFLAARRWIRKRTWDPVEVNISMGNIGKITIRPNYEVIRIAHLGWAELITRKAGLMFDEENDVIIEIYKSWYELFQEFRSLTKSIPAEKIRDFEDAKQLVDILIQALNTGLRPHLTRWQAKYRRWYVAELEKHPEMTPQQIQRLYPEYDALVGDLKRVNHQMVEFAEVLRKIAHG